MTDCVRSITFTIPGSPGVQVYVEEQNGTLVFTASVIESGGKTADLRGLFFNLNDDSKLAGLIQSGSGGKVTDFDTVNVIDLGQGANMQGAHAPYDVGLEFGTQGIGKDDIKTATFTLSNTANNLTLDDLTHVDFGARLTSVGNIGGPRNDSSKLTATAPAAPDANDDSYDIFEDGQSGLNDPSKVSEGVKFEVLANDTDADGDTLTIIDVEGAQHGTVTIIDGDDADSVPGDAVLYTPDLDYAGTDSFTYCISDGNGGTDYAEVAVNVEAVADVPLLEYEVIAGSSVNEFILRVTATQNDADISEFLDRIELGAVPNGVTINPSGVNPGSQPGQIVSNFTLTLPLNQDMNFDLGITAVSKEVSNGDEESNSVTVPIEFEFNSTAYNPTFLATDQSIWDSGDQFTFTDDRFLGIDESWDASGGGGFVFGASSGHLKTGFQSTLHFEGGEVDAEVPYDITVDTNYNKTTDQLLISSAASILPGGGFTTEGPEGTYTLDFFFDFYATLVAGLDFGDLGSWEIIDTAVGPFNESFNILDLDSDNLGFTLPLPAGFSIDFAWPNLDTTSDATNVYNSSGASNDFLALNLDVDSFIFELLGIPNPFDIGFDIGVASGNIELADLDIGVGLNFLQDFAMAVNNLAGTITYENGVSEAFVFGNDILLSNASQIDAGGDGDGLVEFALALDPQATLDNSTDLGFNFNWNFDLLKLNGSYDIVVDSGELHLDPVVDLGGSEPITTVGVYSNTFDLNFAAQDFMFAA